jgi:HK97 family phage major capsid protein
MGKNALSNLKFDAEPDPAASSAAIEDIVKTFTATSDDVKKLKLVCEEQNQLLKDYREKHEGLEAKYTKHTVDTDEAAKAMLIKYTELEERANELEMKLKQSNEARESFEEQKDTGDGIGDVKVFNSYLGAIGLPIANDPKVLEAYAEIVKQEIMFGTGKMAEASFASQFAMQVSRDPLGGYFVRPALAKEILRLVQERTPLREFASKRTTKTDSWKMHTDLELADITKATEWARSSNTDTKTGIKTIYVHEKSRRVSATQQELDDSYINIQKYLAEKAGEGFAVQEGTDFMSGSGAGEAMGIRTYANGTTWGTIERINTESITGITYPGLVNLLTALDDPYQSNSAFMIHKSMLSGIMLMLDGDSSYLLADKVIMQGITKTLCGKPLRLAKDLATVASTSESIMLGDYKQGYRIIDRSGVSVLRDPFSSKPLTEFDFWRRYGGDVINYYAIKIGVCSVT